MMIKEYQHLIKSQHIHVELMHLKYVKRNVIIKKVTCDIYTTIITTIPYNTRVGIFTKKIAYNTQVGIFTPKITR